MGNVKTIYEDCDILVVGGGMAGTGATFEARYWGRDKVFMQLIVIWECSGMKINQRIMYVMHAMT